MKSVTLPLQAPAVRGYQFYAFPLAILANYEEAHPWIYCNYFQVCFNKDFLEGVPVAFAFHTFDYACSPWLTTQRLQRDIVSRFHQDVSHFVRTSIEMGYYVYLNVDEYYIPERKAYHEFHVSHDLLVFGYDDEAQMFDVAGFNHDMLYTTTKVSYQEFEQAYHSLDEITNYNFQVYLYKFNPNGQYAFNLKLVVESLEEYLYSRNTTERFAALAEPMERAYGLDSYEYLQRYHQALLEGKVEFDIRYLHTFWEHKKLMAERLRYMEENGYLDPELGFAEAYRELEKRAVAFRNTLLKTAVDRKGERVVKMIEKLGQYRLDEQALLENLIGCLKAQLAEAEVQHV